MNNPIDKFFSLGDKVTKGDPKRKADFDYYMLWIIFLAFFAVFAGNISVFIRTHRIDYLGWSAFSLAIMWFQYYALKQSREVRKVMKQFTQEQPTSNLNENEEIKEESVDDMLEGFKEQDNAK